MGPVGSANISSMAADSLVWKSSGWLVLATCLVPASLGDGEAGVLSIPRSNPNLSILTSSIWVISSPSSLLEASSQYSRRLSLTPPLVACMFNKFWYCFEAKLLAGLADCSILFEADSTGCAASPSDFIADSFIQVGSFPISLDCSPTPGSGDRGEFDDNSSEALYLFGSPLESWLSSSTISG